MALLNTTVSRRRLAKWCRFQFGLRTLLAMVLAATLLLACFESLVLRPYRIHQQSMQRISALNGQYVSEVRGPGWLRAIIGDEYFRRVVDVTLDGRRVTDADLACLKDLRTLRRLSLEDTMVSDAGLAYLRDMSQLQSLNLAYTRVSDAGLRHLSDLPGLRTMNVRRTDVTMARMVSFFEPRFPQKRQAAIVAAVEAVGGSTKADKSGDTVGIRLRRCNVGDPGLAALAAFTQLRNLDLTGTMVTGAGLRHLGGMANMRSLLLDRTQVTDESLVCLRAMPKLESLGLGSTLIGDKGLAHLRGLHGLKDLTLYYTGVTDTGLGCLRDLTSLKTLNLVGTAATGRGMQQLKTTLPNVNIK